MDILEGPILLACSAATGLYALWQQKYQQGKAQPQQHKHFFFFFFFILSFNILGHS